MRSITLPSRNITAGKQTFQLDSFTSPQKITARISRESWPGTNSEIVAYISLIWASGTGVRFGLPGGALLNKDGTPATENALSVNVPRMRDMSSSDPKARKNRDETTATCVLEVLRPLKAGLTVEVL